MKKSLLILLVFIGLINQANAQTFPMDENAKIVFWEVVKADSMKAGQLYTNGKRWLNESGYKIVEHDSLAGKIVAKQLFGVYDKGYVSKKLHGKVAYQLILELKDNRFRYQFADFVFDYYKEDRNYKFSPTGKQKKLEETIAKGWQNLWENHRKTTFNTIQKQIELIKNAMLFLPKTVEVSNPKPVTKDW